MFRQIANMLQLQRILLPRDSQFFCWRWHLQHLTVKHLVLQVKRFFIEKILRLKHQPFIYFYEPFFFILLLLNIDGYLSAVVFL